MDFKGTSFQTKWLKKSNILRVRFLQLEDNTFDLLDIILDAAVKQGKFSVAWDLSKMQTLTTMQCFKVVQPSLRIKDNITNSVIRSSVSCTGKIRCHYKQATEIRCTNNAYSCRKQARHRQNNFSDYKLTLFLPK